MADCPQSTAKPSPPRQGSSGRREPARVVVEVAEALAFRDGEARAEAERLRRGFLRFVQADNGCEATGKPCREPERCGCHLEMEGWLDDR